MSGMRLARGTSLRRDQFAAGTLREQCCHGRRTETEMTYTQGRTYVARCGEVVSRASAGLIIVGTAGFALAAIIADIL
jgi:hypothetical protein